MENTYLPDAVLSELLAQLERDEVAGIQKLDQMLVEYPHDARLHFLSGSLLAGNEDYDEARYAMRRAVDLAPDFAIARFQLGLLLLSSGQPHAAQETWGPLFGLSDNDPLRLFAVGLDHLIRNRFSQATDYLRSGMVANTQNEPLNADMQQIIDQIRLQDLSDIAADSVPRPSAAQDLIRQSQLRRNRLN